MQLFILIVLIIALCAFGYMTYHREMEKRTKVKKRNQYNDRV
jgi:hypothetical protein